MSPKSHLNPAAILPHRTIAPQILYSPHPGAPMQIRYRQLRRPQPPTPSPNRIPTPCHHACQTVIEEDRPRRSSQPSNAFSVGEHHRARLLSTSLRYHPRRGCLPHQKHPAAPLPSPSMSPPPTPSTSFRNSPPSTSSPTAAPKIVAGRELPFIESFPPLRPRPPGLRLPLRRKTRPPPSKSTRPPTSTGPANTAPRSPDKASTRVLSKTRSPSGSE